MTGYCPAPGGRGICDDVMFPGGDLGWWGEG